MPSNQSKNEGNDDQVFWAFSMMAAAEYKLQDPPDGQPGWLAMTQSVFNQFVGRYQKEVADGICGGGMRWQIYPWLNGWTYKNTATNGGLFHLGARLAMYTGNDTYAVWAEKSFDWMSNSPILPGDGQVYDGTDIKTNPPCSKADRTPWTYNYGIMIAGAAYVRSLFLPSPLPPKKAKLTPQPRCTTTPTALKNGKPPYPNSSTNLKSSSRRTKAAS